MVLGELDSNMHKSESGPLSYTLHKHKLQCMKKLTVRQETIKILEEKIGNNLSDLCCSNYLFEPKAQITYILSEAREIKAKVTFWDLIKILSCHTAKATINKP